MNQVASFRFGFQADHCVGDVPAGSNAAGFRDWVVCLYRYILLEYARGAILELLGVKPFPNFQCTVTPGSLYRTLCGSHGTHKGTSQARSMSPFRPV